MNQQPFFSLDTPLSEQDQTLLAEIEALPTDKQQDAIAMLFGAIVQDYKTASEEQRLTMSPFCKFFADLDCDIDSEELDQTPDAQKPQQNDSATAFGITGKINPIEKSSTSSQIVNQ